MACTKDYSVDMKDLLSLQKLVIPTKPEVKCLLACAYKDAGTMNSKGLYDLEAGYKIAEMMKNGDEKRLENARKFADICAKVNDEEVSDGEKGCERAVLIFKCVKENAPKTTVLQGSFGPWQENRTNTAILYCKASLLGKVGFDVCCGYFVPLFQ
ncbi:unnamed protein product, partial [Brenthis ino]